MKIVADVINRLPSVSTVMKQITYGTAVGLTKTAKDAQNAVQKSLHETFIIRNKWPEVGPLSIKITPATKVSLESAVKTAASFLKPHEEGSDKTPHGGKNIAVPTDQVRRNKRLIIPRGQRPKGLGGKAFVLQTKSGPVLAQRITRGKRKGLVILYGLEPRVKIKKRSTFYEPARKVARQKGPGHISREITNALRVMRF
jgi:hypothetical protein